MQGPGSGASKARFPSQGLASLKPQRWASVYCGAAGNLHGDVLSLKFDAFLSDPHLPVTEKSRHRSGLRTELTHFYLRRSGECLSIQEAAHGFGNSTRTCLDTDTAREDDVVSQCGQSLLYGLKTLEFLDAAGQAVEL